MATPITVLHLCANVDIRNDYRHSYSFSSSSAQQNFFISKVQYSFSNLTFQREEMSIRIAKNIEYLRNINYLMYRNSNKWFYAFVTRLEYVNEEVTKIFFEIDVIQTWYFDLEYKTCFVEREHVESDEIGEHLVEENINIGPIITDNTEVYSDGDDIAIIIAVTETYDSDNDNFNVANGDFYGKVYSGLAYYVFSDGADFEISEFINNYAENGKSDAIVSIFTVPEITIPQPYDDGDLLPPNFLTYGDVELDINITLDGYTPKNNKLLTFPYNFITVDNTDGILINYRYEMFSDSEEPTFRVRGTSTGTPQLQCYPLNYNGQSENIEESMTISSYPQCAWATDIYANWLAQKAVSNSIGVVNSTLGLATGVATSNPLSVASGVTSIASTLGGFYEKSVLPNRSNGSIQSDVNLAWRDKTFKFYQKCITNEFAKIIDDYFTMYGYKVNSLKVPQFDSRPYYNYIKTRVANITGNVIITDLQKINNIFDNGITFWHGDYVGDYSLDNSI